MSQVGDSAENLTPPTLPPVASDETITPVAATANNNDTVKNLSNLSLPPKTEPASPLKQKILCEPCSPEKGGLPNANPHYYKANKDITDRQEQRNENPFNDKLKNMKSNTYTNTLLTGPDCSPEKTKFRNKDLARDLENMRKYPESGMLREPRGMFADKIWNVQYCDACGQQLELHHSKKPLPESLEKSYIEQAISEALWKVGALTGKDEPELKELFVRHLRCRDVDPRIDDAVCRTMERYKKGRC